MTRNKKKHNDRKQKKIEEMKRKASNSKWFKANNVESVDDTDNISVLRVY